jgi:predicted nucleotide-binding protein (sugar kinase/HSP70/actin superfamily)
MFFKSHTERHGVLMNHLFHNIKPQKNEKTKSLTVGIPRAFCYHQHGRLWENFFTMLGCNVVVSSCTNQHIIDLGVKNISSETCLPVKVMAGHVLSLIDKSDVIFIPRYVTTDKNEFTCPEICSLPDMIKLSVKPKFEMMEITLDLHHGLEKTEQSLTHVAKRLELDDDIVRSAFLKAVKNRLRSDMEVTTMETTTLEAVKTPTIALLGHPYMIGDGYISMDITSKLKSHGYKVVTPSNLDYSTKRENAYPYEGRIFYGAGLENLGSAFYFARQQNIKGIIFLTPFACGVDSLVTEFIERHLKTIKNMIPYMKITIDEHTGEAGFDTRIEAFLDMIGE